MSAVSNIIRSVGRALSARSPQILTGMAVAGVVSTTVLAVRATPEALDLLESAKDRKAAETGVLDLTPIEKLKYAWQPYIPAAGVGLATIGCMITANSVSTKRVAAMASLYSITDTAFHEYRDKVVETIGKTKEQGIRDKIAQDHVDRNPVNDRQIIIASGDVLFYDDFSDRYFMSDMETVRRAQNDINEMVFNGLYASHNDFYSAVGLPNAGVGEELGWTSDNKLEIDYTTTLSADNKPCIVIRYRMMPIRGYYASLLD